MCAEPANLRRTCSIAVVVGVVLTLVNQLDVLVDAGVTALTGVKIGLNFCVPFVVSNLGVMVGARTDRP